MARARRQRGAGGGRRRAPRAGGRAGSNPGGRLSIRAGVALTLACLGLSGCGADRQRLAAEPPAIRLPADYVPLPAGRAPAYRLPPSGRAAARGAPVNGLPCIRPTDPKGFAVHLELYADRLVVPVPAGIGIAPPRRRRGAFVTGGACAYPIRSREPTGVLELTRAGLHLGDLFAVWGQRLGPRRMAGFAGPVRAYLGGRRWPGDPRRIPLRRHAEIVLEVGGSVPPHPAYLFAPGR